MLILLLFVFSCGITSFFAIDNDEYVYAESSATTSDSYFCLRDENFFFTQNQASFGTCWDFSAIASFESYLSTKTGQVYDFSETWIAVCAKVEDSSYVLGAGGSYITFTNIAKKYGLLLEEDLPYEAMQNIDSSNYMQIYETYKDKAIKVFSNNLTYTQYMSILSDKSQEIKQQLLTNGALVIGYDADGMMTVKGEPYAYSYSSATTATHAIIIIGWDDTISFTKNSETHTGAWICLNSWGTNSSNEIVYIAYDDLAIKATIAGLTTSYNFNYNLSLSNSNLVNYDVKRYKNGWDETTTGSYKQKNVFYYGENIDLQYSYTTNANVEVEIEKNGIDTLNKFSLVKVNSSSKTIDIEASGLDSGTYVITFKVDIDKDGIVDSRYVNQLFILSGADTCNVMASSGQEYDKCYQGFNTIYSTENDNTIYAFTDSSSKQITLYLYLGTLATVTDVKVLNGDASMYWYSNYLTKATRNNVATGSIVLNIYNFSGYGTYINYFNVTTLAGNTIEYKVITYCYSSSDTKTYVFYENIENSENNNCSYIIVGPNFDSTLSTPTQKGKVFDGWCLNASLSSVLNNNKITSSSMTAGAYDNYRDSSNSLTSSNARRATVIVFASWHNAEFEFDSQLFTATYGDNVEFQINSAANGSGNYAYTLSGANSTGLTFDATNLILSGDCLLVGTKTLTIIVTDLDTNDSLTATITITTNKRKITFTIDDKQSEAGANLETLTGNITSGSIYIGDTLDDLNISLYTDADVNSTIGEYTIYGTWNNSNYIVTFVSGKYKIVAQKLNVSASSYEAEYDGQYHTISIEIDEFINATIVYSLDRNDFSNGNGVITYKDYMATAVRVYAKISAPNYEDLIVSATIKINKKQLTIGWSNLSCTYNGQEQKPTAIITSGLIANDNVDILVEGGQTNAGTYTATASANSTNYDISNSQQTFVINKATPTIDIKSIVLDSAQINDAVYLKDITLPSGYEWENPNAQLNYGNNTYLIKYVPLDTLNYNEVEGIEISITKQNEQAQLVKIIGIVIASGVVLSLIGLAIIKITAKAKERNLTKPTKSQKISKPNQDEVIIEFVTNCPLSLQPIKAPKRVSITLPKMERKYYEFCGWYTDKLFLNPYVSNGANSKLTLYAKWRPKI